MDKPLGHFMHDQVNRLQPLEIYPAAEGMTLQLARRIMDRAIDGTGDPHSIEVRDALATLWESKEPADSQRIVGLGRRRLVYAIDKDIPHESHNAGGTENWSRLERMTLLPPKHEGVIAWLAFSIVAVVVLGVYLWVA